jgi:outer membrane protein assembly factor BamB
MIYFATPDYHLKKIRGTDGTVIWDKNIQPVLATAPGWNVVLSADVVIVEKVDLFAYDTLTGQERWNYVAPDFDETGYSTMVVDDTTVYSASQRGRAYAIDSRTGQARWITDLTNGEAGVAALYPVYNAGSLYLCTHKASAGTFWALNAATGAVRWSYSFSPELPTQSSDCLGDPAVWQDLVIEPQSDGRVFAFDRETGAIRWIAPRVHELPMQHPDGTVTGSCCDYRWAVAFGNNLIVTSNSYPGKIVALDPATGQERWRNGDIPAAHLSHPALDGSTLYLSYGAIYAAFDLSTGKLLWRTPATDMGTPTQLRGRPIITGDRLYIAGQDGSYSVSR